MRLAVPLLPGLWLGRLLWQYAESSGWAGLFLSIGVLLSGGWCLWAGIYSLHRRACHGELRNYVSFGVSVCFLFFFFGLWRSFYAWENLRGVWTDEEREYHAILLNTPQISSRTVGAEAMLMAGDDGSSVRQTGKLWLTFSRDSLAETLRTGDELVFKGRIRRPKNKGNPEEFDYAEYLAVKSISGRVFIGKERWKRIHGYEDKERHLSLGVDLRIKALLWRDRILEVYRNTGLQGEALDLFVALTLGEKSGLSDELKDIYAGVGVSHVLALSGMHLGFLVAMLNLFILNYCRRRYLRLLGAMLATVLVWGYTFLAGLPPSLVRAALMYSLMLVGSLVGRSGFSVNSLAMSAVLMLCINPLWFYDVGFQLSFLAMFGILTICPRFQELPLMRWRFVRWIFQSLLVSFAAQLFTVPLVAYRFGTFSFYSAWATLVISPLTALLIYGMPLILLSGITGIGTTVCAWWIARLGTWQNDCLRAMMEWPYAVVHTDWSLWFTLWCYVVLCVWVMPFCRSYTRRVQFGLMSVILTLCAFAVNRQFCSIRPEIVFYNHSSCPSVHVIYSSERSYLFSTEEDSVRERMSYIAESFWEKKLSDVPVVVTGDFRDNYISSVHGLVAGRNGISFLMLTDNRWDGIKGMHRAEVDFLYVCRGYHGSLHELSRLFNPRCVVLDASLWRGDRKRYIQECSRLGWSFYDMEVKGALKVALN